MTKGAGINAARNKQRMLQQQNQMMAMGSQKDKTENLSKEDKRFIGLN